MKVIQRIEKSNTLYAFWCPGCECAHHFDTSPGRWTWNGDEEKPTVTPSILVRGHTPQGDWKGQPRCHLFIRDGKLQFLGDCEHEFAGKTVPCQDLPS